MNQLKSPRASGNQTVDEIARAVVREMANQKAKNSLLHHN
jgi:hypothetical protein